MIPSQRRGSVLVHSVFFVTFFVVLLVGSVSCREPAPAAPAPSPKADAVSWADVFDGTPDFYAVVRPRAITRDGVYGPFWKALARVALARGWARGATMVEAVEGAEEIVVGLTRADAVLVLRGVPASLDPRTIVDSDGQPLFRPLNERGRILEFELADRRQADEGALFVLPNRTWVGTLGDARARARQAFTTPMHRPTPMVVDTALLAARFGGPLASAFAHHPLYGPLSTKLSSATFMLEPGKRGLVVALHYDGADAAAWGELQAKRVIAELMKDGARFEWLKDASVAYEGTTVFVRVMVPPRLLEELPRATGADFGF